MIGTCRGPADELIVEELKNEAIKLGVEKTIEF